MSPERKEAKRRLLRDIVRHFVARTNHRLDEARQFERLVVDLFVVVGKETIAEVAADLCRHPETPPGILQRLFEEGGEATRLALQFAPVLAPERLATTAETGAPEEAEALAKRPDLSRDAVAALIARGDGQVFQALVGNRHLRLDAATLRALTQLARDDAELARGLLDRGSPDVDREALFLAATGDERAAIILNACRAAMLSGPYDAPVRDYSLAERLEAHALAHNYDALIATIAAALDARKISRVRRMVFDARGEPLALLLVALSFNTERATRVLLVCGLPFSFDVTHVRALRALVASTPPRAATRLVAAMTGAQRAERDPVRRPQTQEDANWAARNRRAAPRETSEIKSAREPGASAGRV